MMPPYLLRVPSRGGAKESSGSCLGEVGRGLCQSRRALGPLPAEPMGLTRAGANPLPQGPDWKTVVGWGSSR